MSPHNERETSLAGLHDVPIVRSSRASSGTEGTEQGWRSNLIYRWHGQAIEVWLGPSSYENGPPACQLRQGTNELAFFDIGGDRSLGRRTGTVFGELISFEQGRIGMLPAQRTIEVRIAVTQRLTLEKRWSKSLLLREDHAAVASFRKSELRLDNEATQAEGIAAILVHASGILTRLDLPLGPLRPKGRHGPL